MNDIKKFCKAINDILPWLQNFFKKNDRETRLQFNVYYSSEDYHAVEDWFSHFSNYGKEQFNVFLIEFQEKKKIR